MKHDFSNERYLKRLEELVSIPSHSGSGSGEIAKFVVRNLADSGLRAQIFDEIDNSVVVRIPGKEEDPQDNVLIYSHLDTQEPQGEALSLEPRRRNGKLHGLGASDDKGSVALLLEIADMFARRQPKTACTLVFSGREEGVALADNPIEILSEEGIINPSCGIILEPTAAEAEHFGPKVGSLGICVGCYGLARISFNFQGHQGHSALPDEALNPIPAASSFIGEFYKLFSAEAGPKPISVLGTDFPVILQALITQVIAAEGLGTIPGDCLVSCEFRIPPGKTHEGNFRARIDTYLARLMQRSLENFPDIRISKSEESDYRGYLSTAPPLVKSLLASESPLVDTQIVLAPGRCDANVLEARGVPCVVVGPGLMKQCHKRDEYISEKLAFECSSIIMNSIANMVY